MLLIIGSRQLKQIGGSKSLNVPKAVLNILKNPTGFEFNIEENKLILKPIYSIPLIMFVIGSINFTVSGMFVLFHV